ncbi:MAG: hypothetical protein AB7F96_16650 [Beijerinckiaceae bacterium]
MSLGQWAMKAFIGAVILLGLFGPYMISVILGGVCIAIWATTRHGGSTGGKYGSPPAF